MGGCPFAFQKPKMGYTIWETEPVPIDFIKGQS